MEEEASRSYSDDGRIFLPSASTIDPISEQEYPQDIENTSQNVRHS